MLARTNFREGSLASACGQSQQVQLTPRRSPRAACELGLEGVVAKLRDAPYRSGRSEAWLKIKCTRFGTFVVTGYEPDRRSGVRSLSIAEQSGEKLVPAGAVGSGLTMALSRDLRRRLDAGEHVTIDVEYRGKTPSGGLRHPALKGVPEH